MPTKLDLCTYFLDYSDSVGTIIGYLSIISENYLPSWKFEVVVVVIFGIAYNNALLHALLLQQFNSFVNST